MKDLAKQKDSDLRSLVKEKKRRVQEMQFSLSKSKPGEESLRSVKKDIARLLTELSARQAN